MMARGPGANSVEEFWQNLCDGKESITTLSNQDLQFSGVPKAIYNQPNYVRAAGILKDEDLFDAAFFEISPQEARLLDPQHRVFLEGAWEVLERAGYSPNLYSGSIGVFAGCCLNDYLVSQHRLKPTNIDSSLILSKFMELLASDKDYLATRVSYKLNLKGPSLTVQTACSTSLVAIHLACQSLLLGECDLALAGGVSIRPPQKTGYPYTHDMIFSRDGHTYTFDAKASGTLFTNGLGIVALKRLEDAVQDGDRIDAIIRGSAINNDGSAGKSAFSAPSQNGQAEVIAEALAVAEVNPESLSYVEAHGTATVLGDPIEVSALTRVFRAYTDKKNYCAIGSVKSNIGHTVHAAGVLGLIKTALMLKHKRLVPSIHFDEPNQQIDFRNSPFFVNTTLANWDDAPSPRRAGVSSFGVGGTNAHVVLEEAPPRSVISPPTTVQVLKLSAKTENALKALAAQFANHLKNNHSSIQEICYTANTGRADFDHRLAIVQSDNAPFHDHLRRYSLGDSFDGASGKVEREQACKIAFLFTGQGSQYVNMGKKLYEEEPVFRESMRECDELLSDYLPHRLLSVLYPSDNDSDARLEQTLYAQPALFAIEYSLAQLWNYWGIQADVLLGHSIGEYAAACIAGVFSLKQGLRLVAERARLMTEHSEPGEMVAVFASADRLTEVLNAYENRISIAAINGPNLTVLSGFRNSVAEIMENLTSNGFVSKRLKVSHAFHSPAMDPILDAFETFASQFNFSLPQRVLVSNLTGKPVSQNSPYNAHYLRNHIRQTVRFSASIQTLKEQGCNCIVEIGPHPVLIDMARHQLLDDNASLFPSLHREVDDCKGILTSLAGLYTRGARVDWIHLYAHKKLNKVELPTYPFQRKRFWIENSAEAIVPEQNASNHPLLQHRLRSPLAETQFETVLNLQNLAYLKDHKIHDRIVFPAPAYLEMMIAAAYEITGTEKVTFREIVFREPLFLDQASHTLSLIWRPLTDGKASVEIFHLGENGWKLIASAEYVPSLQNRDDNHSLETFKSRCNYELNLQNFYEDKRKLGMMHGHSFQGIHRIWKGTGEAVALIQLPVGLEQESDKYFLHPVLVDSCLQVKEGAIQRGPANRKLYLPVVLEEFTVQNRLPPTMWAYGYGGSADANDDLRTVSIVGTDENGVELFAIKQLHLKSANEDAYSNVQETNNIYEVQWQEQPLEEVSQEFQENPRGLLLFCDDTHTAQVLCKSLSKAGSVTCVYRSSSNSVKDTGIYVGTSLPDFEWLLDQTNSSIPLEIVYMWGTRDDDPVNSVKTVDEALTTLFCLCRALVNREKPVSLHVVTRGAQRLGSERNAVNLHQAAFWGFTKVIPREELDFSCKLIDLDPENDSFSFLTAEILSRNMAHQVAYRDRKRFRPQIIRTMQPKHVSNSAFMIPGVPYQIEVSRPGTLDSLVANEQPELEPGPQELVIQVHATGLNFRDVLTALGRQHGPIGFECSGTVTKKGPEVGETFQIGDPVICFATKAFSSFVRVDHRFAILKPARLGMSEAAGVPLAFLTAFHGLRRCAQLRRNERVLIHAAAGGVGLAAVQIAKHLGAEIYATASFPKWDFLKSVGVHHIFSSRDLQFKEEILRRTNGAGVDVVLNSLTDDFIDASLDVMKKNGRFVEIGATNILSPDQFRARKPEGAYFAYRLSEVALEDPDSFQKMFRAVAEEIQKETFHALPTRIFAVQEIVDSFRHMAQAKHIGKVVISCEQKATSKKRVLIDPDSSYLITGGMGALGLYVAEWLCAKGAKQIILMGRRAPSQAAESVINDIRQRGTNVRIMHTDVSSFHELERAFQDIADSMPPLRGIWHTAGILVDALLRHQTVEKMRSVTDPKIHGSWNLHLLTKDRKDLDYFVLFSSMSAISGAGGQTTYAAANAFLDGLAHLRRHLGLPAISINWGSWGGGGMAVALDKRIRADRQARGILELAPQTALKAMERILQTDATQIAVTEIDWSRFMQQFFKQDDFYFQSFAQDLQKPQGDEKKSDATFVKSAPVASGLLTRDQLIHYLKQTVAQTLGIQPDEMNSGTSLSAMGIDSLMSIEMSNRIQKILGIQIPMVTFLKGLTVEQLAGELLERMNVHPEGGLKVQ
jgi:acyl transferase domain-containing protein/NAD(P)-dependent dehydrogenase (short-subunit alcohol dehydrogenase family)/acyl carrier protein